jgi:hypothetical protein
MRPGKSCEHIDCGGFACAIGTQKAEKFSLVNSEAYFLNGSYVIELFG